MHMIAACSTLLLLTQLATAQIQHCIPDTLITYYLQQIHAAHTDPNLAQVTYKQQQLLDSLQLARVFKEPQLSIGYLPWRIGPPPLQVTLSQKLAWPGTYSRLQSLLHIKAKEDKLYLQLAQEAEFLQFLQHIYRLYTLQQKQKLHTQKLQLLEQLEHLTEATLDHAPAALTLLTYQARYKIVQETRATHQTDIHVLLTKISQQIALNPENLQLPDTLHLPQLRSTQAVEQIHRNTSLQAYKLKELKERQALIYAAHKKWPDINLQVSYLARENRVLGSNNSFPTLTPGGIRIGAAVRLPVWRKEHQLRVATARQKLNVATTIRKAQQDKIEIATEMAWQQYAESQRKIKLYNQLITNSHQALALILSSDTHTSTQATQYTQLHIHLVDHRIQLANTLEKGCYVATYLQYLQGVAF